MLDNAAGLLACRARTATLSAVTTGSTSLSATTSGFARAGGSFLTDGFMVGAEVQPAGFATNTPRVITAVAALLLSVSGLTAEAAAGSRSLVIGQPAQRGYPNVTFNPAQGFPFTEEEWLPGPSNVHTLGQFATIIAEPIYVLKWYGLAGKGDAAISKPIDALLRLYAPGTAITLPNGDVLRVRTDTNPTRSQILNPTTMPGYALVTVTIPLEVQTTNAI